MSDYIKTVCQNRKAYHLYHIKETIEAGVVLLGPEVKSLRQGHANLLSDSHVIFRQEEAWLYNVHISPYKHCSTHVNIDPSRPRKLLLHKKEIKRLMGRILQQGYSLIPLKIYFKNGKAKVELALVKGKKQYDKRSDVKKRDIEREWGKKFKIR